MIKKIALFVFIPAGMLLSAQTEAIADSIRKAYKIPELAYAVVSSDKVYELQVLGVKKINTSLKAQIPDKFRLGSNTKAITGFIAARLVKEHKLSWDTKFFDLFPELKAKSDPAYHELTLLNLVSFRTKLISYTYTYAEPTKDQFSGDEDQQRYQFAEWFFKQKPFQGSDSMHFSNLGYVAAGLMMEKVTKRSYKQLVTELGQELGISFGFGAPNSTDKDQPWGHDKDLKPEPPGDSYKLNWLLAAGNINVSLPDYIKFIQLQLAGLKGRSYLMSAEEFNFLFFGLKTFSAGWFNDTDDNNRAFAFNNGNPGTFLSSVYVYKNEDKAFIILCNAQTEKASAGIEALFRELYPKYIR